MLTRDTREMSKRTKDTVAQGIVYQQNMIVGVRGRAKLNSQIKNPKEKRLCPVGFDTDTAAHVRAVSKRRETVNE